MATESVESSASTSVEPDPEPGELSQQVAFETLSSRRRRHVLHYLLQEERPVDLRELSTQLAAWENDTVYEGVTYKERMRVYTALRQSHLPRMAENGIVEFDEERSVVELTPEAAELEVYLDIVPHDSIPWSSYYLGLGVFGLGLVAAKLVGLPPFALVPGVAYAGLVTLLFAVSAAVHVHHDRKMRLGGPGRPPTGRGDRT